MSLLQRSTKTWIQHFPCKAYSGWRRKQLKNLTMPLKLQLYQAGQKLADFPVMKERQMQWV